MQPYFLPYIGYWQLIHAVDTFVLLDDVQFIRHGWINRNRILSPSPDNGNGWRYIIVPLSKHSSRSLIREVSAISSEDWRLRILKQLEHYKAKTRYFPEINELLREALYESRDDRIAHINFAIIRHLCKSLRLDREILLSSELAFDYSDVGDPGDWALSITRQLGADIYINPIGGISLFNPAKFANINSEIHFLQCRSPNYSQRRDSFEPALSIVDVMMFNGLQGTRQNLEVYDIFSASFFPT